MTSSGDAAEQVVRISLEGLEIAARLAGAGAKNIAVFLYAALARHGKDKKPGKRKTHGRERLKSMVSSGKELKIFSIRDSDLKSFAADAKRYGIVYCVLRSRNRKPDGLCDIMVKAEDAARIDRILTRFNYVDRATLNHDKTPTADAATEKAVPQKPDLDTLVNDMMTSPQLEKEKTVSNAKPEAAHNSAMAYPQTAKTAKTRPSKPFSEPHSRSSRGTTDRRPSVRAQLRDIAAEQKKDADRRGHDQRKDQRDTQHSYTTRANIPHRNLKKKMKGRSNR